MRAGQLVDTIELKVADATVGQLRMRSGQHPPDASLLRLITTLIASEVERVRAPERASEEAATLFLRAVLSREHRECRGADRARPGAGDRPVGRRRRAGRARAPAQHDRGRLAPAVADDRRAWGAVDRARIDRRLDRGGRR